MEPADDPQVRGNRPKKRWVWNWSGGQAVVADGLPLLLVGFGLTYAFQGVAFGWFLIVVGLVWNAIAVVSSKNLVHMAVFVLIVVATGFAGVDALRSNDANGVASPTETIEFISANATPTRGGVEEIRNIEAKCYRDFSQVDPGQPFAHQCIGVSDGAVFDPCYTSSIFSRSLLCFFNPWSTRKTKVSPLTPAYLMIPVHWADKGSASRERNWRQPWAMELGRGIKCLGVTSVTPEDPAGTLYRCSTSVRNSDFSSVLEGPAGWVIGPPNESSNRWTVQFARVGHTDEGAKPRAVIRAWR